VIVGIEHRPFGGTAAKPQSKQDDPEKSRDGKNGASIDRSHWGHGKTRLDMAGRTPKQAGNRVVFYRAAHGH
jgi:hypothetical protein